MLRDGRVVFRRGRRGHAQDVRFVEARERRPDAVGVRLPLIARTSAAVIGR
jgi:hypothetical protein